MLKQGESAGINQTTLMNFIPTRPLEDIANEYVDAFWRLYEPKSFLDRTYRHFLLLGEATYPDKGKRNKKPIDWITVKALATICWRQGVVRDTRVPFWRNLWSLKKLNPGGISSYLTTCAQIEHFVEYRVIVKEQIEAQLAIYLAAQADRSEEMADVAEPEKAIAV